MRSRYVEERFQKKLGNMPKKEVESKHVIPRQSDKRKEDQREYRKIVAEMMKESTQCEVKEEGCQQRATGAHHKQKRSPKNLLDRNNLMRACDSCQLWIELHPQEAMNKGYSISRFSKKIA